MFRLPLFAAFESFRSRGIALLLLLLLLAPPGSRLYAQAGEHGAAMTHACSAPVRVCNDDVECSDGDACTTETCDLSAPGTVLCSITIINVDDFGDTLHVLGAYDVLSAASGNLRIPSSGSLEIYATEGNTDCVAGPFVPCNIGPADGVLPAGSVQFQVEGYNPTLSDLAADDSLFGQGTAEYVDNCDGQDPFSCNPSATNQVTAAAAISLLQGCEFGEPVSCDDGNDCTTEQCDPGTGACEIIDTVVCDDGNACTEDWCDPEIGACLFAENVVCDNSNACLTQQCDPGTGACEIIDTVVCDDGNACTEDWCDPEIGACLFAENVVCDNSDACFTQQCNTGTGACEIIDTVVCDDGNACTDDLCDPGSGECLFAENVVCDDGNACTTEECNTSTGECEFSAPLDCDDGNACTDDWCDPAVGLCLSAENVVCDDGNACTTEECNTSTGECEFSAPLDCDDGNACTDDWCDPASGFCLSEETLVCDDGNTCTDDACNPATGACVFAGNGSCNETPIGTDVEVSPIVVDQSNNSVPDAPDVTVTFENVQGAGDTTVVATEYPEGATPVPSGFKISGLSGGAVIYDIESDASLAPGSTFEICFDYSSLTIAGDPADLALVHEVDGVWEDITSSNDTVNKFLCGISDSFSFYAILEPLAVVGPLDPVAVGTEVSLGIDTSGAPIADTIQWLWGDGSSSDVPVVSSEVVAGHTYQAPGVYIVTVRLLLTAGDAPVETGSAEFRFVVVYDPSAGFVTGGGWIDSPTGALVEDPIRTGKAQFGFVSKYKKGAQTPTGSTEFQFHAGGLHFRSSEYEWLLIAGARAQFKGTGTLDDTGDYGFMLTVVDAALTPSTEVDLFRIKIWDRENDDQVVYDNELDAADDSDPSTAIGGGSITIHKSKN